MTEDVQAQLLTLEKKLEELQPQPGPENKISMVVFSGDLDKLLAAMINEGRDVFHILGYRGPA